MKPRARPKVTPFLWFDHEAEEAASFYVSLFEGSRIVDVSRYGEGAPAPKGTVMTVTFELAGQRLIALNGGPHYRLNEAFSLCVDCESQQEIDALWSKLADGGEEQQCGWVKDRFGLSWQIVPGDLVAMLQDPDPKRARRVMETMLSMRKIELAALKRAHDRGR